MLLGRWVRLLLLSLSDAVDLEPVHTGYIHPAQTLVAIPKQLNGLDQEVMPDV